MVITVSVPVSLCLSYRRLKRPSLPLNSYLISNFSKLYTCTEETYNKASVTIGIHNKVVWGVCISLLVLLTAHIVCPWDN